MSTSFWSFIYVGIGGMAGALMRYSTSLGLQKYSLFFPFGTLLSNWAGCFIIGIIAQLAENTEILSPEARLLLATGFCGGFTTLSSMIFEMAQFARDGEVFYGSLYFLATFLGAFLSFYAGMLIIRLLFK
ncbi:MAG: CrcB family protein [Candidatus Competibacteraceae bacterium]|jgi:CrcB protein|nr:CrcB family protein [Candidatus Competibacteraceae bacterium]